MLPKWHILIGFLISILLVYFFKFTLLAGTIIFVASWLIDIDHYFWYAIETKDWNLFHALRWYRKLAPKWLRLSKIQKEKYKRGFFLFHGISFWLILGGLSFLNEIFLWILIGVAIHMILDWIDLYFKGEPFYTKICPLYVLIRNRGKKMIN